MSTHVMKGNYALPGILAGARRADTEGIDYAPTDPSPVIVYT